jgi:RNA polymerase sigma-70 factor (family 1)
MELEEYKRIYLPMKDKLYRFALRYVQDTMAAEDIVQEVFMRIWRKRFELVGLEKPDAYCMTITRNLSLNYLKDKHRLNADLDTVTPPLSNTRSPDAGLESEDKLSIIRAAIKTLSKRQQMVLHLREVEELTYDQIAEAMELTLAMVKSELFRARQHLKTKLSPYVHRF